MRRPAKPLQLDFVRRTATLNGQQLRLQEKACKVLLTLADRAPNIVRRETLIDEIWQGNILTGDKGLNQAMWAIRSALGDDAREPTYIETLPRIGYRWIYRPTTTTRSIRKPAALFALAASLGAVAIAVNIEPTREENTFSLPANCEPADSTDVHAYRVDRRLFVDLQCGCRMILDPSDTKQLGDPLVSDDGRHIAFTVTEDQTCKLVTLALQDGSRTEFGTCYPDLS